MLLKGILPVLVMALIGWGCANDNRVQDEDPMAVPPPEETRVPEQEQRGEEWTEDDPETRVPDDQVDPWGEERDGDQEQLGPIEPETRVPDEQDRDEQRDPADAEAAVPGPEQDMEEGEPFEQDPEARIPDERDGALQDGELQDGVEETRIPTNGRDVEVRVPEDDDVEIRVPLNEEDDVEIRVPQERNGAAQPQDEAVLPEQDQHGADETRIPDEDEDDEWDNGADRY